MTFRVCVFCGSRPGTDPRFAQAAQALGQRAAALGIGLVYGGGSVGLMGTVADACMAAGGEVIGVIPGGLFDKERAHTGVTELHSVGSMHERKALMTSLSDAFLSLPGGAGTLDETFEAFTWRQIGIHHKPLGLLDVAGFYRPLLQHLEGCVAAGFIPAAELARMVVEEDPEAALLALKAQAAG